MQLASKIGKISELNAVLSDKDSASDTLVDIYKMFDVKRISTFFDNVKSKGVAASSIVLAIILSRLMSVTVRAMLLSGQGLKIGFEKDTIYRLKNNALINWRKLLYYFISRCLYLIKTHSHEQIEGIKCFIIDDSDLEKVGRMIEFIGKIYNHVIKKSILGFKILTLGIWDGKSFNAVDFALQRELGKNPNRPYGMSKKERNNQFTKIRDPKSAGYKRVKELDINKIDNAISMLKRAVWHGLSADYVLLDCWFVVDKMIHAVRLLNKGAIHLLGMCRMDGRKYLYKDKELNARELIRKTEHTKLNKRCRKIKSHYIQLEVVYKGTPMQLFFTKQSGQKDWRLLVTTNMTISYIKAIEIYQIRWAIEVFFKECKQYLQLGKSQSNDFDAQIADTTISFITYMLLNLRKRFAEYETLGDVFREENKMLRQFTLWEKLWGLFQELLLAIIEILDIDVEILMDKIITEKPGQEKILFMLNQLKEHDWQENAA